MNAGLLPRALRLRCDSSDSALAGERPVVWLHHGRPHHGRPLRLPVESTGLSLLSMTAVSTRGEWGTAVVSGRARPAVHRVAGGIRGPCCCPHVGGQPVAAAVTAVPPVPMSIFPWAASPPWWPLWPRSTSSLPSLPGALVSC